jgi:tyrosyl-tRNA synthetase
LFGSGDYTSLDEDDFRVLESELPIVTADTNTPLVDLLVTSGLAQSKGEARRFLADGAVYLNGSQLPIDQSTVTEHDVVRGYAILRRGKNTTALVKMI